MVAGVVPRSSRQTHNSTSMPAPTIQRNLSRSLLQLLLTSASWPPSRSSSPPPAPSALHTLQKFTKTTENIEKSAAAATSTAVISPTSPAASPSPAAPSTSELSPHATPFTPSPPATPAKLETAPQRRYVPHHKRSYTTIEQLFMKFNSTWSRAACSIQFQSVKFKHSIQSGSTPVIVNFTD